MRSENILISIIIPTYNRASFITKTIESVLGQDYRNFELIVVDDGSTDNTEEEIAQIKDERLKYYKKENAERGAARNYGKNIAIGDYINFLDSDDTVYPNHLSEAAKIIELKNNPEFFHLGYDIKQTDESIINLVNNLKNNVGKSLVKGNILSCNGVFLRKDIAQNFGFSEEREMSGFEDWELWLRLAARYPLEYSNTITSSVFNHADRSVLITKKAPLIRRKDTFLMSILKDDKFCEKFGDQIKILEANLYTYIALHLAITKEYRRSAIQYLLKGILTNPKELFSRRFMAIVKHIIL